MTSPHSPRRADRWVYRIEDWRAIDPLVARIHELANSATRRNTFAKNALSGTSLGHPAHPALVAAPLGCWVGALTADLVGERRAAARLTAPGLLAAIPAVATGLTDWTDTTGAEQRVGSVHLVGNLTTIALCTASGEPDAGMRTNSGSPGLAPRCGQRGRAAISLPRGHRD
jgi:hypothetical protein